MTPEEFFNDEMKALREAFEAEKRRIILDYARMKNPYKTGDVLKDHYQQGEVISWKPTFEIGHYPDVAYKCRALTKDGKPTKKLEYVTIYLSNVKNDEQE